MPKTKDSKKLQTKVAAADVKPWKTKIGTILTIFSPFTKPISKKKLLA